MNTPQRRSAVDPVSHNSWATAAEGLATALWYSLPDYVVSRKRRAAAKAAVVVGAGLYGAYLGQGLDDEEQREDDEDIEAQPSDGDALRQGVVIVAAGVAFIGGAVVFERLIQRSAESLSERGVKHPHTVIGVALGALTPFAQQGIQRAAGRQRRAA